MKRNSIQEGLRVLGRRAHSCQGMSRVLCRKGYSATETEECIKRLSAWGYLKDEQFAEDRIAHYRSRGKGREYIAWWLLENGLTETDIRGYLDRWYPPEEERRVARLIAEKRLSSTKRLSQSERNRILRYLASAGFSEEAIRACGYTDEDT